MSHIIIKGKRASAPCTTGLCGGGASVNSARFFYAQQGMLAQNRGARSKGATDDKLAAKPSCMVQGTLSYSLTQS